MPTFKNLKSVEDNGILTITISRPESLNALNLETVQEIGTAFQWIYDDASIKGVIITGDGEKAFVAGADIKEIALLNEVNSRKFAENGQEIFAMIEECEKPVIAAVNGFALGGGCELAMACHIRIATENAKFGQPEVNLGLIPGYGGTQRLTRLVGKGKALELLMTADTISANEAKNFGLVNHVVTDIPALFEMSNKIIRKILSKAPIAIGMITNSVNAYYMKGTDGYQTEANNFQSCCRSADFKEGTIAFIEKRKPEFKGV